jgi:hypothetical protein
MKRKMILLRKALPKPFFSLELNEQLIPYQKKMEKTA